MSSPLDIKNCEQEVGENGAGRRQKLKNRFKQLFTLSSRPTSQAEPPPIPVQDTVPVEPPADVDGNGKIDAGDRCDWETIHSIPDDMFRRLLLNGTDIGRRSNLPEVAITCKTNGSYHKVIMLQLSRDGQKEDYVLRIPAHGTSKLWTEQDEYMMQREVELMIYFHLNTKVPVPEVIDFATYIEKGVGFPYILMQKLPGNTAYNIWFDDVENYNTQDAYFRSDCPSPETETKRVTFLHSLAAIMFELGQLHFDQIGVPIFDMCPLQQPPTIGSSYHWNRGENGHEVSKRPAFKTTMNYISSVLDAKWDYVAERSENVPSNTEWRHDNAHCMYRGIRKMLDVVFALPAFNQENETFTICHPDLDLQDILTDEEGNITGIIDWEGSFVAPRCIGSAALPKFLNRDWFPSSVGGLFCAPHLLKRMDYYRNLYATSLQEQGCHDAYMTFDYAMYAGVMSGLLGICGGGDMFDFTEKFLRSMPSSFLRRVDHVEFLVALGRDWPHAETILKQELAVFMQHEA